MSCHLGFFVWNGSAFIVPAGSYELPFLVTHIGHRLTYPTIISIWQEMAAHMSKWQLICRTYTHIAKNTIYIVVVRYGYAYNVICPTIPIYKPSFWVKIHKWFDICLPGQIYVCSVRYMSALSDICPTIPIYKLSFCISIQIWFDICLPCRIYVCQVRYISDMADIYLAFSPDMGILARHISGWLDIYRDISSYVRPIETLAPKKPDIWQFVTIYIQPCGFMNRFFFQTHIKAGSYALWHDMWAVFLIYDMPLDFYHSKWLDMRAFFCSF